MTWQKEHHHQTSHNIIETTAAAAILTGLTIWSHQAWLTKRFPLVLQKIWNELCISCHAAHRVNSFKHELFSITYIDRSH